MVEKISGKIVMCGCHEGGWFTIRKLLEHGIEFAAFVSLTPEQAKTNKVFGYRDFSDLAKEYDIPIYFPKTYSLKSSEDLAFFQEHDFDLLVQGGWQRLFPKEVLDTLSIGAIGGHGSSDLLPKGRGRSPMVWSLVQNKKRFIKQLFIIKEGVDDGCVFDEESFDILASDDIRTLYYKASIITERMLIRSIPKLLNGTATLRPQTGSPSYYNKRTEASGEIFFEQMDVWQISNAVRAQSKPYPGAFFMKEGRRYRVWKAQVFDTRIQYRDAEYGEVVERFDNNLVINCLGGLLLVTDYEIES